MIEIPESTTISRQAIDLLTGKTVKKIIPATSPHKFAWYSGTTEEYTDLLTGRKIESARGHGMFVDILCDDDICISVGDGTNLRYNDGTEKHPGKHQMIIEFSDNSFLVFTVAMYGAIYAYRGELDNPYHKGSLDKITPLDDSFNESYMDDLFRSMKKDVSVKAFLATEQRVPGLGNGVLQDILFQASLNPKKKISAISDIQKSDLFYSIKVTIKSMTDKNGRNTEKDLYGNFGEYKTILSRNTYKKPCPNCGGTIVKEAYLGGSVYYCPNCQKL